MKITESDFSNQIVKHAQTKLGDIYFFNHIAIIEFNEGVHIEINNSTEIFKELKQHFGEEKPFGVISNRINSYSVKLLDIPLFKRKLQNLDAYAVVGYNSASKMNATIENAYCLSYKTDYDNVYEAIDMVHKKVKYGVLVSLD